jgi:hypothetical protein
VYVPGGDGADAGAEPRDRAAALGAIAFVVGECGSARKRDHN